MDLKAQAGSTTTSARCQESQMVEYSQHTCVESCFKPALGRMESFDMGLDTFIDITPDHTYEQDQDLSDRRNASA